MLLSFFGGLLLGSGTVVLLLPYPPIYPKPIAAVFVLVGIAMMVVGIANPAVLWSCK